MTGPVGQGGADYRLLPSNIEAEQALLGAMLVDNTAFDAVAATVEPDSFHVPVHGRIYDAIRLAIRKGQLASPITLRAMFVDDEALADAGGADYLAELASAAVSVSNAQDYGRVIRDLSVRRELIHIGQDLVDDAYNPQVTAPAAEQIEAAETALYRLTDQGRVEAASTGFPEALTGFLQRAERAVKRGDGISGVPTGLTDLDAVLGGLQDGDLIILAGRPSMGKTAMATGFALNAARPMVKGIEQDPTPVAFFSLEMPGDQVAGRILAERSGISAHRIRRGAISDEEFAVLVQVSQELSSADIQIDDTAAMTIGQLHSRARRMKRRHGIGLVIVDYLQLVGPNGKGRENRVQDVSEITRGLKAVAKDLDVPVLALSQLSRAVEQREDKRPHLSDLRESGSIEQDADVVMFVYREEYYLARAEPVRKASEDESTWLGRLNTYHNRLDAARGKASLIVAKQRSGPIDEVELAFEAEFTRFTDLANP